MLLATTARTLRTVSIVYLVVGLIFATASWAPIDAPGRLMFDLIDWPVDGSPPLERAARVAAAVGGGLLVGFAALCLLVVAPEIERGNLRVVRGTIVALLAWFVVDSAGSIGSGVWTNALLNVPFLLFWLVPLWRVRKPDGE